MKYQQTMRTIKIISVFVLRRRVVHLNNVESHFSPPSLLKCWFTSAYARVYIKNISTLLRMINDGHLFLIMLTNSSYNNTRID